MNIAYRILTGAIIGAILAGAFCVWTAGAFAVLDYFVNGMAGFMALAFYLLITIGMIVGIMAGD